MKNCTERIPVSDSFAMGVRTCASEARQRVACIDAVYQEVRRQGRLPKAGGGWCTIKPVGLDHASCQTLSALARREVELLGREHGVPAHELSMRVVEIGFAFGLSTLAILRGALGAGVRPEHVRYTAIDPYAKSSWGDAGRLLLERCGLDEIVTVVEEDSAIALPRMLAEGDARSIDLLFIDGGHRFEEVFLDLTFASRLIAPGRLVVVDDIWMASVCKAIRYYERNGLARCAFDTQRGGSLALLRFVEGASRAWDAYTDF